ncbi:MAG: DUF4197 domain-containing protein [Mariprofundaceae bacterium]|nr:DUF4197 domain-containing protein [Mariprofundaceae bacterium]
MPNAAFAGWMDDALSDLNSIGQSVRSEKSALTHTNTLTNSDIDEGLKQALRKGVRISVDYLGHTDGFWKHPDVRIPLPGTFQTPARYLQKAGLGSYTEQLQKRMNRAAEEAVPLARTVFYDAIRSMRFSDVRRILQGKNDAATRYFERKTIPELTRVFSPIVHRELNRSGAVRSYRAFSSQYASLPFVGQHLTIDLDEYVTKKALAAMFTVLAHEEARIRHDPAARTTQLLRSVFR